MGDIFDILRPGVPFTGKALLDAIVDVAGPPTAGRGIRVTSLGPGKHTVHYTKRRVVGPRIVRFLAVITGNAELSANRWTYEWTEAEMNPEPPSPPTDFDWSPLAGGRTSSTLGEAFNRYELRHTDLVALGGVTLASLPSDVTVLAVPDDALVELTEYTSTGDIPDPPSGDPDDPPDVPEMFRAVWFDRPNGVEVTCPAPPPLAATFRPRPVAEFSS